MIREGVRKWVTNGSKTAVKDSAICVQPSVAELITNEEFITNSIELTPS
jgi:hypothetical protein